ncbi:MAG: potassium channel family protein [Pseudomonadales bacterium]
MVESVVGGWLLIYGVLTLVFITGPLAIARSNIALATAALLALLVLLPGIAAFVGDSEAIHRYSLLAGIPYFSFLAMLLIRDLLVDKGRVDAEKLWAAVNVYILIGVCFAFWYAALSAIDPAYFSGKFVEPGLPQQKLMGFVYFSFVTLTTLGYGDISANTPGVATLTYLEALIGQLYIAIMIARLVSLYSAKQE